MVFAVPFFLLLMFVEWLAGKLKGKNLYYFPDTVCNLLLGIGSQATGLFVKVILFFIYDLLYRNFAFFEVPMYWLYGILFLIAFDFVYYWAHRWSHEMNFLWGAHIVHHQSEEYNLSVALRQPWFHSLLAFFLFVPFAFIGIPTIMFGAASLFVTLYQFWIHTKAINRLPKWFEFVFNSPTHHRVHHARDPKYIDRNHAAFLIIWDRIFGTYKEEEEEPTYGITKQFASWNPVWANFHHYFDMWTLFKKLNSWKDRLLLPFRGPGWLPEEMGGTLEIPDLKNQNIQPYRTNFSKSMSIYVGVQLILLIAGLSVYMVNFDSLSLFYKLEFFGIIVLTSVICGAIMEQKKWVILIERVRLLLVAVSLSTLYHYYYENWFVVVFVSSLLSFLMFNTWLILYRIRTYRKTGALV